MFLSEPRCFTVTFHIFKSHNFKLSVSNPQKRDVAYLSVLSRISNCQGLGRKNKFEILKTDGMRPAEHADMCWRNAKESCLSGYLCVTHCMAPAPSSLFGPSHAVHPSRFVFLLRSAIDASRGKVDWSPEATRQTALVYVYKYIHEILLQLIITLYVILVLLLLLSYL